MTKAIKATAATTTKASVNPFEALTKTTAKAKAPAAKKAVAKAKVEQKVTKKSQAVTFYKKNIKKGKAAVIQFFKGDLSMTDAGANSYFYAIKKEVATAA